MRMLRNILTGMRFKPLERHYPEWMCTDVVRPYDRAIPDEVWSKNFRAWN